MSAKVPLIYLVDDDDAVRESLRALLEAYQMEVEDYTSGPEFLSRYSEGTPACLLLDMNMPEMDGLEILTHLRNRLHSNMPIVMITGQTDAPTKARLMQAGATSYFEKPVDVDGLIAAIRSLTAQGARMDATRETHC